MAEWKVLLLGLSRLKQDIATVQWKLGVRLNTNCVTGWIAVRGFCCQRLCCSVLYACELIPRGMLGHMRTVLQKGNETAVCSLCPVNPAEMVWLCV